MSGPAGQVGTARLTAIARQVTAALDGRPTDPLVETTVLRAYAPDWLDPDYWADNVELANSFTGRRLYVFGSREVHEGAADRGDDDNRYAVTVIVFERYVGDEKEPPTDWLDDRVAWVEANVLDYLGDARTDEPAVEGVLVLRIEWLSVYNPDLIRQMNLFRSEVLVTYQAVEDIND